jgi:hypothetical protein
MTTTTKLARFARLLDEYTLWAFNPQPPLGYRTHS